MKGSAHDLHVLISVSFYLSGGLLAHFASTFDFSSVLTTLSHFMSSALAVSDCILNTRTACQPHLGFIVSYLGAE